MHVPKTSLQVDRFALAAVVVLTCVLFTAQAADPVNVIKLAALTTTALLLLVTMTYRALRCRVVQIPVRAAGLAAVGLLLALLVSTATAPVLSTAVLGAYGRNSGLLAYASALVLFLAALRTLQRPAVLIGGVVFAGLFTSTYGLLQRAGVDAVAWNNPFNPIIAALGNPNFASGYLGIAASVAAGAGAWSGWARGWRVLSGITAVLCLVAAALSSSVQGPIAAAGGLTVVAFALILNMKSSLRKLLLAGLSGSVGVALALLLLGALTQAGPAAAVFTDVGSRARVHYWTAALEMFRDHPVLGVGLDQYGNFWRSERSVGSVELLGGPSYSDAAHSVPLQVLAQGGLLMALVYALFLGVAGFALVRGLLRLTGPDRTQLAAVGAGWTAYQVQSLVSIDQVPLIVLHFVLAGAVIATAGMGGLREFRLPGAPPPPAVAPNDARTRRRVAAMQPAARALGAGDILVLSAAALVAVVAAWTAIAPLRASMAAQDGDSLLARGNGNLALDAYESATDVTPGVSVYWSKIGNLYDQVQQPALAGRAYRTAAERDPYDVNAIKAAGARSEAQGDLDTARQLFARAVELDPLNSDTLVTAATFELRHSGAKLARALLERAVTQLPGHAALWATLGDARAVTGDPAGAREAYERALALQPDEPTAVAGLRKLDAAAG